jgi:hypothetical protein
MDCVGWASSISFTLRQIDGVCDADADAAAGRLMISHDPARASDELLRKTVELCGLCIAD